MQRHKALCVPAPDTNDRKPAVDRSQHQPMPCIRDVPSVGSEPLDDKAGQRRGFKRQPDDYACRDGGGCRDAQWLTGEAPLPEKSSAERIPTTASLPCLEAESGPCRLDRAHAEIGDRPRAP
jgi:hypothetical protein